MGEQARWGAGVADPARLESEMGGAPEDALRHLEQTIRLSRTAGTVITERAALEQRLRLRGDEHDRTELRFLLERMADSLPAELRTKFLAGPRAAVLRT